MIKEIFERIGSWQLHKKKYAPHIASTLFTVFFIVGSIFSYNASFVYATTYNFVQSSWAGGVDTSTVVDANHITDWTKYYSQSGLTVGTDVQLPLAGYTFTDDTATSSTASVTYGGDFDLGTNSSTAVSSGSVILSSSGTAGSGADGAVTISSAKNINTDTIATGRTCADGVSYNATALTANTATLSSTPSAGCLAAGDIVLLANLQGTASFHDNVGNYEFLTVGSVSGSTVTFTGNKTKYYGDKSGNVDVLASYNTASTGTGPARIAVSSDGAFAYITNGSSNTVSMYSRNTSTGALTALSPATIATGTGPAGIVISADGTSVYVADSNSSSGNKISMYSRNTSTGALTALSPATIATETAPTDIAISADGTSVYVTNLSSNTVSMYSRNTSTGALTALGTPTIATETTPRGITISADGTSVYVGNYSSATVSMYSRNTSTGALTALGTPTIATGTNPWNITIAPDGTSVYVTNMNGNTVSMYSRNTSTGALTALGTPTIATGASPRAIAITPDGTAVYVTSGSANTVSMYSRNTSTGMLTALSTPTIASGTNPNGIAVAPDGTSVYVTNSNSATVSVYIRTNDTSIGTASTNQKVILQRVPQYTNVTVASGGSLTANAWYTGSAYKGGVLALYASGTVDVQSGGSITATNKGFRAYGASSGESYTGSDAATYGAGTYWDERDCAGGEVGSSGGYGTTGFSTAYDCYGPGTLPGGPTYGVPDLAKMFLGAGGGIGSPGGGIVYVNADTITVGGSIVSKGTDYGAGGSIFLQGSTVTAGTNLVDARLGVSTYGSGRVHIASSNITGTTLPVHTASSSPSAVYASSGTFTSAVVDLGTASALTTLAYTTTTPANTTLTMDIRAGDVATPDGTWTSWTTGVASGGDISALGPARYVQYRANLATTDSAATPSLDDVDIGFSQYGSGSLISSIYDSGDAANLVANMLWTASGTSGTEVVKFQIRSAATSEGIAAAAWCGPDDASAPCSGTSYFTDSAGVTLGADNPLRSGGDDRYFQYQVLLSSGGAATPVLTQATVQYVVNTPPDFDATYGTNGVSVSQNDATDATAPGAVVISYKVRDADTNTGSATPGYVTPSFEYNTGSGWTAIPSSDLAALNTEAKPVDTTTYATHTATWFATSTTANTYTASAQVRVTVDDGEAANATVQAASATFTLDTRAPTVALAIIDASAGATTASTTVSISDDAQLQYRLCNDAAFPSTDAQGNSCAWTTLATGPVIENHSAWTYLADADGNIPVYLQAKDALGNTTATQAIVAPAALTNFDLKDISNPDTGVYKEFVSWSVFTATTSVTFASYDIYSATSTGAAPSAGSYTRIGQETRGAAYNFFVDDTITASDTGSTRFYKVVVVTTQGNTSPFAESTGSSTVLSDIPNGTTTVEVVAPSISGGAGGIEIPDATLKNSSAVVMFSTVDQDLAPQASYGSVRYQKADLSGWTTVEDVSFSSPHAISLTGLSADTTYIVQVSALDATETESSGWVPLDNSKTFTTKGGPIITKTPDTNLSDTSITINWDTATSSDSYVYYSTNSDFSSAVSVTGNPTHVTSHAVALTSLTPETRYYYYVQSTDSDGITSDTQGSGDYFVTEATPVDLIAPVISNIATPVVSATAAVITWQTDKLSNSQVVWGTTSGNLNRTTTANDTASIFHIVTLSSDTDDTDGVAQGLTAETPYYYKVLSTTSTQGAATGSSTQQTLTTTATGDVFIVAGGGGGGSTAADAPTTQPVITAVTADSPAAFTANVKVQIDKNVVAFVEYGKDTTYGSTAGDPNYTNSKVVALKNLIEGTTYHYKVTVIDQFGNTTSSSDQTFKTTYISELLDNRTVLEKASDIQDKIQELIESSLPSLAPPFITNPAISSTTENSAVVTWRTNVKSNGSVRYSSDTVYAASKDYVTEVADSQDPAQNTSHEVVLTGLLPNTLYHLQVRSYVFPQVVGKSADITFSTKAAPVTANIVAVKNDGFTVVWETDTPTSSIVEYADQKTGKVNRVTDTTLKTYHNVQIENIPSGTTYIVSVSGMNKNNNLVQAEKSLTVTTSVDLTPPVISSFKVDNALVPGRVGFIQTVVGWQTDKPSNSVVYYEEGAGVSVGSTTPQELSNKVESLDAYTLSHVIILPNLRAGTVYRIKVVSTDQSGNTKVFGPTSIITPIQTQSVLDIIVKNFEDTFKFLGAKQ